MYDNDMTLLREINDDVTTGRVGDVLIADDALYFYFNEDNNVPAAPAPDSSASRRGGSRLRSSSSPSSSISPGSRQRKNELVVTPDFPMIDMVAAVHVGGTIPHWFTGFTGVSAAVPASAAAAALAAGGVGDGESGGDGGGGSAQPQPSAVWLDSFTVPIYPYKIGQSSMGGAVSSEVALEGMEYDADVDDYDDTDDGWLEEEEEEEEEDENVEEWTKKKTRPHPRPHPIVAPTGRGGRGGAGRAGGRAGRAGPPGGGHIISRVVALNEADYNVPCAYVEFHRMSDDSTSSSSSASAAAALAAAASADNDNDDDDDGLMHWMERRTSAFPLKMPFILFVAAAGAVAAFLFSYSLMNSCCSELRRKRGGYSRVD